MARRLPGLLDHHVHRLRHGQPGSAAPTHQGHGRRQPHRGARHHDRGGLHRRAGRQHHHRRPVRPDQITIRQAHPMAVLGSMVLTRVLPAHGQHRRDHRPDRHAVAQQNRLQHDELADLFHRLRPRAQAIPRHHLVSHRLRQHTGSRHRRIRRRIFRRKRAPRLHHRRHLHVCLRHAVPRHHSTRARQQGRSHRN